MIIRDKRRSLETCTESGWEAYDLITDTPLCEKDIECFKNIEGSFVYLKSLKKPFFKTEHHDYVIKGVQGDDFFRFAAHRDRMSDMDEILSKTGITIRLSTDE